MKGLLQATTATLLFSLAAGISFASDQDAPETTEVCPVEGKPVKESISTDYEGKTYSFCSEACRDKFQEEREASLYHQLGGRAAIDAAVDLFYVKVLADDRVNFFFEDINMMHQHRQQKAFLSAALGGPEPWTGKDMRKAHKDLDLEPEHFNAIAEHLLATLQELKVDEALIEQVMAVVGSTRSDVLNLDE